MKHLIQNLPFFYKSVFPHHTLENDFTPSCNYTAALPYNVVKNFKVLEAIKQDSKEFFFSLSLYIAKFFCLIVRRLALIAQDVCVLGKIMNEQM